MSQNVGLIDRIIRIALGLVLLALVVVGPRTAWGFLGLLPLASGTFAYCPAYRLFKFTTNHPHHPTLPPTPTAGPA